MALDTSLVSIDGSYGEGGGQIVRTALALAIVTKRPFQMTNIRARRSKPGLKAQHLTCVLASAALCNAKLTGAELGSIALRFEPQEEPSNHEFAFDVAAARGGASAGATSLVAQTLLVPMTFLAAPTLASVAGGTHVPMSPTADYVEAVYAPLLNAMGASVRFQYDRAGFFPIGGGSVSFSVEEGRLTTPITMVERGKLKRLTVYITTSQLPDHVAERGFNALLKDLSGYGVPATPILRHKESAGAGAAITLVAESEAGWGGWTALGERGKPIERVAKEAFRGFLKWYQTRKGVDPHLSDQLALPAALIAGQSCWTTSEVTEHLRTVLWLIQQFLEIECHLEEEKDGSGKVTLRGTDIFSRKHRP